MQFAINHFAGAITQSFADYLYEGLPLEHGDRYDDAIREYYRTLKFDKDPEPEPSPAPCKLFWINHQQAFAIDSVIDVTDTGAAVIVVLESGRVYEVGGTARDRLLPILHSL